MSHDHLGVVEGDARDPDAVRDAVRGTDAVISVLALRKAEDEPEHSEATRTIVEALEREGVRRIVVTANNHVFGDDEVTGEFAAGRARTSAQPRRAASERPRLDDRRRAVRRGRARVRLRGRRGREGPRRADRHGRLRDVHARRARARRLDSATSSACRASSDAAGDRHRRSWPGYYPAHGRGSRAPGREPVPADRAVRLPVRSRRAGVGRAVGERRMALRPASGRPERVRRDARSVGRPVPGGAGGCDGAGGPSLRARHPGARDHLAGPDGLADHPGRPARRTLVRRHEARGGLPAPAG